MLNFNIILHLRVDLPDGLLVACPVQFNKQFQFHYIHEYGVNETPIMLGTALYVYHLPPYEVLPA